MDSHSHRHGEETPVVLNVEGMTCAHCAMTITKILEKSGAENPVVNFATGEASFFLQDNNKLKKITDGILKAGYKVVSQSEHGVQGHGLSSLEKKFLFTLPFTTVLFFSHMIFRHEFALNHPLVQLVICIPVFFVGCMYFGRSALNSIKVLVPNMDVLIMIGSGAAFVYSVVGTVIFYGTHDVYAYIFYETAATIITLVLLGNVIEHRSVKQTTSAISELSKLQTTIAKKVVLNNGNEIIHDVPAKDILAGDILVVNAGDKVPADGTVLFGNVSVDESMITGESVPVEKEKGDKVIAGTISVNGTMRMLVLRVGKDTVLSTIINIVKDAQKSKPAVQKFGDKVSAIFVPVVLFVSILTLFICYFVFHIPLQKAFMNSIAVLVISCPCAMGLATPTAVMVGIGRAAKNGILIKGGSSLEEFARVQSIVFDKTGTLTTGNFRIKNIQSLNGLSTDEVETVLYHLEQHSSHPIAKSIVRELKLKSIKPNSFYEIKEIKGIGIEAKSSNGNFYKIGSFRIASELTEDRSHTLYILKNNSLIGTVDMEDETKINMNETIEFLKFHGINPVMLSGDEKKRCEEIAKRIGIKEVYSEQLPEQKLNIIESISRNGHTAMVGDGINDAPALAKASVGISIGNASQVAIQSSQIILLNEKDMSQLQTAFLISKHTLKTIKQNIFWAFFYNVIAIPVAAAGFLSPMIGALAMAFSDVIVIGNSIRLRTKKIS